jgi:MraZ protein
VGTTGRQPVLIGEFELTLDEKNRLLIPADVRRAIPPELGDSFYLTMGVNRVPWLWIERAYEDLVMETPVDMIPGEDALAFNQMVFGLASKLAWDKAGRVLVPDRMLKRAAIGKEVTLVGVKDHLELWDRTAWENRRDELERRALEVFDRARQARQGLPARPAVS